MNEIEDLRQYNEVWENRRLFTACIEMMLWYRHEDTIVNGQGQPSVLYTYQVMTDAVRSRANYFSKCESVRRSKIKRDSYDIFPHSLAQSTVNTLGPVNQITFLQGQEYDKSDVFFDCHLTEYSYIRFGLTIEEVLADPEAYVALCLKAVGDLPFRGGMAGLSMNYEDVYINGSEHLTLPIIARYKGVNVINPWRYRDMDGVPTINWLTFVSAESVARLGGLAAIEAQVAGGVKLYPLTHGLMLRAGERPLLGSVNRQEAMDDYYTVGRILAPVKSTIQIESDVAGDDDETTAYIHRFFPES